MGLTISKRLVGMMDGENRGRAKPARTASFTLPSAWMLTKVNPGNPSILVIDGSQISRRILEAIGQSLSFSVGQAPTGAKGLTHT